jgi:hypothetical protein
MNRKNVLDKLSPGEAQAVLKELVASDSKIRKKAEEIAIAIFRDVDLDEIAQEVFWELDSIAVEDVWDNSGRRRDGYVDPGVCAWNLFEEALEPFKRQLEKYQELSLNEEAKRCCLGILKGIHEFQRDANSEFKSWAVDAPGHFVVHIYDQWRRHIKQSKDIAEMKTYVESLDLQWARMCK